MYCEAIHDYAFLKEEVKMMFGDETPTSVMTVEGLIQWIMESVGHSIDFVEWNAPAIDNHMQSEGFHIQIQVDMETGFVTGGNVRIELFLQV